MGSTCNKAAIHSATKSVLLSADYLLLSRLTFSQTCIIKDNWQILKEYMANIGVSVFIG